MNKLEKMKQVLLSLLLCTALLCGCAQKEVMEPFVSEDYMPGNSGTAAFAPIMETEKGYYYSGSNFLIEHNLRYMDKATGKDIYLCNKPECKHDGNEFCVATTNRFHVHGYCLYSDRILVAAVEETDTHYEYKLLSISLDGSQLTDLVTYYSVEKSGLTPILYFYHNTMVVHRNKVILQIVLGGEEGSNVYNYGMAFVDLDTMEVTYENPESIVEKVEWNSMSNSVFGWQDIRAYGDSVYYWIQEGHKKILYERNLIDGTVEEVPLLTNFKGDYAVYDEDTIFYTRALGNKLYIYHRKEDKHEEIALEKELISQDEEGNTYNYSYAYTVSDIVTDGTYIYIGDNFKSEFASFYYTDDETEQYIHHIIHVFDKDGKEIQSVELDKNLFKNAAGEYVTGRLNYMGEDIYIQTTLSLYKCKREDFIQGNANFTKVFDFEKKTAQLVE